MVIAIYKLGTIFKGAACIFIAAGTDFPAGTVRGIIYRDIDSLLGKEIGVDQPGNSAANNTTLPVS
jgi:hypothetical protein